MSYTHCIKHDLPSTNGCPLCSNDDADLSSNKYEVLRLKVLKLPHLMKAAANDPFRALCGAVDLLETPNNLDALWVWSKFLWAFGTLKTWEADTCLDRLLFWFRQVRLYSVELNQTPWYRVRKCRKLRDQRAEANRNVLTLLGYVHNNLNDWQDLAKFEAHRGKGNHHERPSL